MIIKKYEAIGLNQFSTFVEIGGKRIDIDFTPGYAYSNKFASYTTSDKDIQEALENKQMFKMGRMRIVSAVEKIEPPKEVKIVKQEEVAEEPIVTSDNLFFENVKALQVYLMKSHKVSFAEIRSKENALAKAEALGLDVKLNA